MNTSFFFPYCYRTMATKDKDSVDALLEAHPVQFVAEIDGETLSYRDFPASDASSSSSNNNNFCLVVLPGYGGAGDILAADLAIHLTDHRLIGVNPRGWMDSSLHEEIYDHQQDAKDVMELLDKIGVFSFTTTSGGGEEGNCAKRTVMILGHSSGGCTAAYMAVMFSERISACFLYDSIPLHGTRFFPMLSAAGSPVKPFRAAVAKDDFVEHCQGLVAIGAHSPEEAVCRTLWDLVCGGGDWMPPLGSPAMRRFHEACQKHRSRVGCNLGNAKFNITPIKTISSPPTDWLQKLKCPMIVMHGSKDIIVPTNVMKAMVTDLAVYERWTSGEEGESTLSYYEIEGAGHFAFIEKPTEFISIYRKALNEKVLPLGLPNKDRVT